MSDLLCEKHNIHLSCMAGCSAHRDNWYCPECETEKQESEDLINKLEKIYIRNDWREVEQLVIYESEIKQRLSELLIT